MNRRTKIVALAAAGVAVTVGVVIVHARSASAAAPACAVTNNRDVIDFVVTGDEVMASPPTIDLVGAGVRTPGTDHAVRWETTPRYPTKLGKIRWFAYQTYRDGDSANHNPAARVVLVDGTVLNWVPSYPNVPEKWVSRNVAGSATWRTWLLDHGDKLVQSYGVALGPNTAGAHGRFNAVTLRTDRFCDQNNWVRFA